MLIYIDDTMDELYSFYRDTLNLRFSLWTFTNLLWTPVQISETFCHSFMCNKKTFKCQNRRNTVLKCIEKSVNNEFLKRNSLTQPVKSRWEFFFSIPFIFNCQCLVQTSVLMLIFEKNVVPFSFDVPKLYSFFIEI